MPTSGVSKAKKLKLRTALRSVNLLDILADQDKENNPSNNIIQMQIERKLINPRNAEVGTPFRRTRKVNSRPGNSRDNIYTLINTSNTSSTPIITSIINISVSALLASAFSQKRAESLASRPLSVLSEGSNSQINKTLSAATLRMLYQQLEHQRKHLNYQDGLLKKFKNKIKDLHSMISMLLIGIKGTITKSQGLSQQAAGAIIYAAVVAEAVTHSSPPP